MFFKHSWSFFFAKTMLARLFFQNFGSHPLYGFLCANGTAVLGPVAITCLIQLKKNSTIQPLAATYAHIAAQLSFGPNV